MFWCQLLTWPDNIVCLASDYAGHWKAWKPLVYSFVAHAIPCSSLAFTATYLLMWVLNILSKVRWAGQEIYHRAKQRCMALLHSMLRGVTSSSHVYCTFVLVLGGCSCVVRKLRSWKLVLQAKQEAEEDARAAERAQQQAQAAIKAQEEARAARQAEEEAQAILTAKEEARAARQAEEEAQAALKAEQQARAALQAELEAQNVLRAEEAARAARQAEEEAVVAQQAKAQAEVNMFGYHYVTCYHVCICTLMEFPCAVHRCYWQRHVWKQ